MQAPLPVVPEEVVAVRALAALPCAVAAAIGWFPPSSIDTIPCLLRPHPGPVSSTFEQPPCPFCAGRRGITLAVEVGDLVVSPGAGRVTFAGSVAGVRYVTMALDAAHGVLVTVGRLGDLTVRQGQAVLAGQPVATAGESLLLTVRIDGVVGDYVDPRPLLGTPRWHPRLVPADGSAPRPARPASLRCPAHA